MLVTPKVIAFDADDTLWVNETYFRDAENEIATLLTSYETENKIHQEIYKLAMQNLPIYGYGVKGFVLSMTELALKISNGAVSHITINRILEIGKDMLNKPIELLPDIPEVLAFLAKKYRLIVVTKGDLLDQEKKLKKSNLLPYFHHIEVLSDKKESNYSTLLKKLDIDARDFLMVGNSLKSDILPLLAIGGQAIHIPFHTTWAHEHVAIEEKDKAFMTLSKCKDLLKYL